MTDESKTVVEQPNELHFAKIHRRRENGSNRYHVASGDPKQTLDFEHGQRIRVRWPDGSQTRQNVCVLEDVVETKEGPVESRLFGFYRLLEDGYKVRGARPKSPRVWIGVEEVEIQMSKIELLSAGVVL